MDEDQQKWKEMTNIMMKINKKRRGNVQHCLCYESDYKFQDYSQINIIDNNDISINAIIQTKMYALYKRQSKQQKQTLVSQVKIT